MSSIKQAVTNKQPVLCVIGTRPEAVKMAPVVRELRRRGLKHIVLSTGQHRELVHQTMDSFGLTIDLDLDLMTPGQSPTEVAGRVLSAMGNVLDRLQPSWMIVQGDTTTVMASAIAGAYAQVRVAHLEAGLRTGDKSQPFPEELNRIIAAGVANLHLAPTLAAQENLRHEGIQREHIVVTGNTVVDALFWARQLRNTKTVPVAMRGLNPQKRLILLTAHRRENFGAPIEEALRAIADTVASRSDIEVLYPVHPNPNVRGVAEFIMGGVEGITLCDPLDYFDLVAAMTRCHLVITDSGGIQEEAPALSKPVLVLRDVTERPEAVETGVAVLVGTDRDNVIANLISLLDDDRAYDSMAKGASPYGDGNAAERAVCAMLGETVHPFDPSHTSILHQ